MSQTKKNNATPSTPSSPTPSNRWPWWQTTIVALVGVLVVGVLGGGAVYAMTDRGIVPHTTILGQDVGGKTSAQALDTMTQKWTAYEGQAVTFTLGSKTISLSLQGSSSAEDDQEVIYNLASFDAITSANAAFAYGHTGSLLKDFWQRLSGVLGRRHEFGNIAITRQALEDLLAQEGASQEIAPADAKISFVDGVATVTASSNGMGFDYQAAANQADHLIRALKTVNITVRQKVSTPTIASSSALTQLAQSDALTAAVALAPITIQFNNQKWTIDAATWKTMLGFTATTPRAIGVDRAAMTAYLDKIRPSVDHDPVEAKLSLVDGKVKEFAPGAVGQKINTEATIAAMNAAIAAAKNTVTLAVDLKQPNTETADSNTLGITEMVATATTSFKGSPTNRRYNISYGAKLLNGLILKPGETLSLVKALGKIDAKHGWKPELVILGTSITPEYGGGLCQVATTLFRSALNAGLPIVERHNHSLRISYYEPPVGLDATIYEPQPDLKFTNDYSTPLLLQTAINGTDLTFTFYGTKDGRSVNLPTPTVYNRVGIPATKYIEVTTLKPGEEKCQRPGHPGADAKVTYTVTYADGHKNAQTFTSHYRAMGVICQVGKKTTTPKPTNSNTNSSTNTNSASNVNATSTNS